MILFITTVLLTILCVVSYEITLNIMYKVNTYSFKEDIDSIITLKKMLEYASLVVILFIGLILYNKFGDRFQMYVFYVLLLLSFIYIKINISFLHHISLIKFYPHLYKRDDIVFNKFFCAVKFSKGKIMLKYRIKNDRIILDNK